MMNQPQREHPPTGREVSAGVIIYRETPEGPKFLLLYHGGRYWNFPKGKLDGESRFEAAKREVREETGIGPNDLRFREQFRVKDRFVFMRGKERIFKTVTFFLAETRNAQVKLDLKADEAEGERHDGYGWFLYHDALRMLMAPNLKRNLKRAYALIVPRKSVPHPPRRPSR
jgi:bis(5'-nucleosidyl)-tetraphosphatase